MSASSSISLSVSELTQQLRERIEVPFQAVAIRGELVDLRRASSGHAYFILKDGGAQLPCVCWRGVFSRYADGLRDGVEVVAHGAVQIYPPHGRYQLVVSRFEEAGLGEALAKLEALKAELAAEGLFDAGRKRPLPTFPKRVGLITAKTGAAIHDFMVTAKRRGPADIVLAPVPVQGDHAPPVIAEAIARLGRWPGVELLVVTRGGGSLLDLMPFSDERVVRAIAASPIPVVSAIGHEIDTTLSDMVADHRAATPTAAAELVIPDHQQLQRTVTQQQEGLERALTRRLRDAELRFDRAHETLRHHFERHWLRGQQRHQRLRERLVSQHPQAQLMRWVNRHALQRQTLIRSITQGLAQDKQRLQILEERLRLLAPLSGLDRGFALVRDARGAIVRTKNALNVGDTIAIQLRDGQVRATVTESVESG